jgi:hypothetical protein
MPREQPKLYLTYDYSELSKHAIEALNVAKENGWGVTDAPTYEPKTSRPLVTEHDALLLLSGWTYNPPAGPTQHELDWETAGKGAYHAVQLWLMKMLHGGPKKFRWG